MRLGLCTVAVGAAGGCAVILAALRDKWEPLSLSAGDKKPLFLEPELVGVIPCAVHGHHV